MVEDFLLRMIVQNENIVFQWLSGDEYRSFCIHRIM